MHVVIYATVRLNCVMKQKLFAALLFSMFILLAFAESEEEDEKKGQTMEKRYWPGMWHRPPHLGGATGLMAEIFCWVPCLLLASIFILAQRING